MAGPTAPMLLLLFAPCLVVLAVREYVQLRREQRQRVEEELTLRAIEEAKRRHAADLIASGTPPAMAHALARAPEMFTEARRQDAVMREALAQRASLLQAGQGAAAPLHGDEGGAGVDSTREAP